MVEQGELTVMVTEFSMTLRGSANLLVVWVFGVWEQELTTHHGIESPALLRQVGPSV